MNVDFGAFFEAFTKSFNDLAGNEEQVKAIFHFTKDYWQNGYYRYSHDDARYYYVGLCVAHFVVKTSGGKETAKLTGSMDGMTTGDISASYNARSGNNAPIHFNTTVYGQLFYSKYQEFAKEQALHAMGKFASY